MPFAYSLPDSFRIVPVVPLDDPCIVSRVGSQHKGRIHELAVRLVVEYRCFAGVIWQTKEHAVQPVSTGDGGKGCLGDRPVLSRDLGVQ